MFRGVRDVGRNPKMGHEPAPVAEVNCDTAILLSFSFLATCLLLVMICRLGYRMNCKLAYSLSCLSVKGGHIATN